MVSKDKNIVNFDETRKKRAAKQKQQRKTDEKKAKEANAEANRVKFGRTGAQKKLDKKRQADAALKHEQHRLAPTSDTKQTPKNPPASDKVIPFDLSKATSPKEDDK